MLSAGKSPEWPATESGDAESHLRTIQVHFDGVAPNYLRLKDLNRYYHRYLGAWCRNVVPPGSRVLDAGCGRGDLLRSLNPSHGVGVDLSGEMITLARQDHPGLELHAAAFEKFDCAPEYDAVLLVNVLEYTYDPCRFLKHAGRALRENGRVLITTANPLWSGIFRLSSRLGLRIPDCKRLFLTNPDLRNLMTLNGFEIVREEQALILPKGIPVLAPLLNWIIPRIPLLRTFCSTQLIVGRKVPKEPREYSVSVVIPCYNEVQNIPRCIREAPRLGTRTEVIFVDDGSKDGTSAAVRADARSDVEIKLVSYSPNRGKGNAVAAGFQAATGDILLILDADLTTPAEDLDAVYDALAGGTSEFVNCTRMVYPMNDRAMRVANFVGNRLFTSLVSWLIERRVTDTLCGTKAFFRRDLPGFTMGRDPWGDYDLLFSAGQLRLALREVPVHYKERTAGMSKMKAFSHAIKLFRICLAGFVQVKTLRPLVRRDLKGP